jgi:hypothetical protein
MSAVRAGDSIAVGGLSGAPARRGVVLEVLGAGAHEHYRVRWDEQHESLFFPGAGEGVHTVHPHRRAGQGLPRAEASAAGNYGSMAGTAADGVAPVRA